MVEDVILALGVLQLDVVSAMLHHHGPGSVFFGTDVMTLCLGVRLARYKGFFRKYRKIETEKVRLK